jgi:hypothetical protein
MGYGPQPAPLGYPRRQLAQTFAVGDIEDELFDALVVLRGSQGRSRPGERLLVNVDQYQDVDHLQNAVSARQAHAPPSAGGYTYGGHSPLSFGPAIRYLPHCARLLWRSLSFEVRARGLVM